MNLTALLHQFSAADPYNSGYHHHAFFYARIVIGLLLGFLFLGLLQLVPPAFRRRTIALFTFLGGAYYAIEFFWPIHGIGGLVLHWNGAAHTIIPLYRVHNYFGDWLPTMGSIASILQAAAAGLGVVSLLGLHLRNTARRREGWGYSAVLIVSFFAMLIWGLLNAYEPDKIVASRGGILQAPIRNSDIYDLLFYGGFAPLNAAMFALIGFFIISASYRAFRIRSLEASLLMLAAVVVMLGQVTLGTYITHDIDATGIWSNFRLENMATYILTQINGPAMRGIYFGIGVGFLATSLRLWLSLERGVYFDTEL